MQWCTHTNLLEKNFLRMCSLFVENFDDIELNEGQKDNLGNGRYLKGDGPTDHRKRQHMTLQRRAYKLVQEFLNSAEKVNLNNDPGNVSLL